MSVYIPGDLSSLLIGRRPADSDDNHAIVDTSIFNKPIAQRPGNADNAPRKRVHSTSVPSTSDPAKPVDVDANAAVDDSVVNDDNKRRLELSDDEIDAADEKRRRKKVRHNPLDDPRIYRTLFLGNVPLQTNKSEIKAFLCRGNPNTLIETIRFRSLPISNPKLPRKVVAITKSYHPERTAMNAYVVISHQMVDVTDKDATEQESAQTYKQLLQTYCTALNGEILHGHHIRVDLASASAIPVGEQSSLLTITHRDVTRTVFIGNLNIITDEEQLHQHFSTCGRICNVRIVRDRMHNVSKGIAYIEFDSTTAVKVALALNKTTLNQRELRVLRCLTDSQLSKQKLKSEATAPNPSITSSITPAQRRLVKQGKLDIGTGITAHMGAVTSKRDIKTKLKHDAERVARRKAKKVRKQKEKQTPITGVATTRDTSRSKSTRAQNTR